MIAMPLIVCFAELRWLMSSPAELIGMYNSLLKIAEIFDPYIFVPLGQPDTYLSDLVNQLMEHVRELSVPLAEKIQEYLQVPGNVKSFGSMIKKYLNSLGFYLLNVDVCLYVWDQIILKVEPVKEELFWSLAALLVCSEHELMMVGDKWSDFMEMVWLKGKAVTKDLYVSKFLQIIDK
jgi:hypothetical protein